MWVAFVKLPVHLTKVTPSLLYVTYLSTHPVTESMVQGLYWKISWPINSLLLWNPEAHRRIHKSPQLGHVLSHLNSVHSFTIHCLRLISIDYYPSTPRYVGACHHGMARPRVADGGDGLPIWRTAANTWNKQSRKPNPQKANNFSTSWATVSFSKWLCSVEFVTCLVNSHPPTYA
jgi:hypothetical protein